MPITKAFIQGIVDTYNGDTPTGCFFSCGENTSKGFLKVIRGAQPQIIQSLSAYLNAEPIKSLQSKHPITLTDMVNLLKILDRYDEETFNTPNGYELGAKKARTLNLQKIYNALWEEVCEHYLQKWDDRPIHRNWDDRYIEEIKSGFSYTFHIKHIERSLLKRVQNKLRYHLEQFAKKEDDVIVDNANFQYRLGFAYLTGWIIGNIDDYLALEQCSYSIILPLPKTIQTQLTDPINFTLSNDNSNIKIRLSISKVITSNEQEQMSIRITPINLTYHLPAVGVSLLEEAAEKNHAEACLALSKHYAGLKQEEKLDVNKPIPKETLDKYLYYYAKHLRLTPNPQASTIPETEEQFGMPSSRPVTIDVYNKSDDDNIHTNWLELNTLPLPFSLTPPPIVSASAPALTTSRTIPARRAANSRLQHSSVQRTYPPKLIGTPDTPGASQMTTQLSSGDLYIQSSSLDPGETLSPNADADDAQSQYRHPIPIIQLPKDTSDSSRMLGSQTKKSFYELIDPEKKEERANNPDFFRDFSDQALFYSEVQNLLNLNGNRPTSKNTSPANSDNDTSPTHSDNEEDRSLLPRDPSKQSLNDVIYFQLQQQEREYDKNGDIIKPEINDESVTNSQRTSFRIEEDQEEREIVMEGATFSMSTPRDLSSSIEQISSDTETDITPIPTPRDINSSKQPSSKNSPEMSPYIANAMNKPRSRSGSGSASKSSDALLNNNPTTTDMPSLLP
jgi:hypothetical protein